MFEKNADQNGLDALNSVQHEILLYAHQDDKTFSELIKKCIILLLPHRLASQPIIAKALNIDSRTVQRKLKKEGTSFQSLKDEVRITLANTYLQDHDSRVERVARLLGYKKTTSFYAAFQRWHGMSPNKFKTHTLCNPTTHPMTEPDSNLKHLPVNTA